MGESERRLVLDEIRKPLDVSDIAREVETPARAAEVYAASLLATDIDIDREREYLRSLATALRLVPGCGRLPAPDHGRPEGLTGDAGM
ncbi:MAG: DUF533 domain-containing protein [Thioalkalivibrio sp.]|nr:MAG: DUF533 domain-containing protein [Thioalkalivibrio sp.]